jgi:hypothetical protein
MKRVVSTFTGYRAPKPGEDFTHVFYTKDEYHKNELKIGDLERDIERLERDYRAAVERYKKSANDAVAKVRAEADERVAEAVAEMELYKKAAEASENMNRNLVRVAKERANVQRGLKPKKQHIGYLLLNMEQITHRIGKNEFICCRARLQSPYQLSFDADSARDLIKKDLLSDLGRRMGVGTVYMNGGFDEYDDETKKIWDGGDNFIFRTLYKANPQRGFWEVEYLVRHMPSIPPEMLREQ